MADVRRALTGVRGPRDTADAFADAWRAITGRAGTVALEERLYRFGTLRPPTGVAGSMRRAADGDRVVLVDWMGRFFVEAFGLPPDGGAEFLDIAKDSEVILWDVDGTPVSMAMLRAPAAGVSRIGPVFAPGYASRARLRLGGHCRNRTFGPRARYRRRRAVRRSGQPDVERHLPTHRLRTGRRLDSHRVPHARLIVWAHT